MVEEYFPDIPGINMSKLQMAPNSAYSITKPKDAKQIEQFINKHIGGKNLAILDGTANVGGDVINFGLNPNVARVVAIEINPETFAMLENNIRVYGKLLILQSEIKSAKRIYTRLEKKIQAIHGNSLDIIGKCADGEHFDILFLDAPWGGTSYKAQKFLDLEISGKKLADVVGMAQKCRNIDNIILKIPFNYNLFQLIRQSEFHTIVIEKIKTVKRFYMILLLSLKK
jgi:16S rRNA G966 N2-methylase RsmD